MSAFGGGGIGAGDGGFQQLQRRDFPARDQLGLRGRTGHLGVAKGGNVGHGAMGNPGRKRDVVM